MTQIKSGDEGAVRGKGSQPCPLGGDAPDFERGRRLQPVDQHRNIQFVGLWVGLEAHRYDIAHVIGVAVPAVTSYVGHKYYSFARKAV